MTSQPRNICELFQATADKHADEPALRSADTGESLTWREYRARVEHLAGKLAALGVAHGDTVALMMTNRIEFHVADAACLHLGAIPFSVYNTSSTEQVAHLFANAGNRLVVCEGQFRSTIDAAAAGSSVEQVLEVETDLPRLFAEAAEDIDIAARWRAVSPNDVLTIIYTSGTTGPSKGVELTHGNALYSIETALAVPRVVAATDRGRGVSYLPDAHIANRWVSHYIPMGTGVETVTVANMKEIAAILPEVQPTVFAGVPTLWYKLKAGIEDAVAKESGLRGRLVRWGLRVGETHARAAAAGEVGVRLAIAHRVAERLILASLRRRIGMGQIVAAVSGAAPISVDVLHFVQGLGIPVAEAWAMSETCNIGTLTPYDDIRAGTVGTALPGVELRLAEDGELLLRSPGVMRGYRNDPARTAEAVDAAGWLHTGDIATIDPDGYVTIVDRKKEIIINAAGKNMSPANIEGAIRVESSIIDTVVAIGDRRPYVTALVVIDREAAQARGLAGTEIQTEIQGAVDRANAHLSRVEQVKSFTIVDGPWQPGGDELTPTLKLKRGPIADKYAADIDALYPGVPVG